MSSSLVKRNISFILFLVFTLLLLLLVDYLGGFSGVDRYFYDTFLRLKKRPTLTDQILIVAIDSKSLERYGRWPIPRRYYAELLGKLDQAAVVGFDLLLTEPSDDDRLLAEAISRHGRVVLPVYLDEGGKEVTFPAFFKPRSAGHIHIEPDVDHVVRGVYHTLYHDGRLQPSLTSVMHQLYTMQSFARSRPPLKTSAGILQQDHQQINYYGPPGTFRFVSMVDLLDGKIPPDQFRGKLALLGLAVPGTFDELSTPLSQSRKRMYGVEVHANILANLIDHKMIRQPAVGNRLLATLLLSLAMMFLMFRAEEKLLWLIWGGAMIITQLSIYSLLASMQLWIPPALLLSSFSVVSFMVYLYRLDTVARRLDHEAEAMAALLGSQVGMKDNHTGLSGFLTSAGIGKKIERQLEITARLLELHQQLEEALKSEREALEGQIRFVDMLSHEYRTPLAVIRANLDILEMKDSGKGKTGGNLFKMKRAVSRLVEVLDTSLGRDRLEGGGNWMTEQLQINMQELLERLVDESREMWQDHQLELDAGSGDPPLLFGNWQMLKTAMLNLVDNAIKYSPEGSRVKISLIRGPEQFMTVEVSNRGALIPEAESELVFEKFYRCAGSVSSRGAGLGLYLVRKIIRQAGGEVTIASNPDDGITTARVVLPQLSSRQLPPLL